MTIIISLALILVIEKGMFSQESDTVYGAFALICACIWIGIFNSIQNICRERDTIKHEYREGMNLSAYILSHTLFDALMCVVETAILSVVIFVRFRENLEDKDVVFVIQAVLILFLVMYCSDLLGILVSSFVKSSQEAMSIMPFLLIFQLVFAGVIFILDGACKIISYLTISKWGFDGLITLCGYGTRYDFKENIFDSSEITSMPYLAGIAVIVLFSVVYVKLSSIVLKSVEKDER